MLWQSNTKVWVKHWYLQVTTRPMTRNGLNVSSLSATDNIIRLNDRFTGKEIWTSTMNVEALTMRCFAEHIVISPGLQFRTDMFLNSFSHTNIQWGLLLLPSQTSKNTLNLLLEYSDPSLMVKEEVTFVRLFSFSCLLSLGSWLTPERHRILVRQFLRLITMTYTLNTYTLNNQRIL